MKNYFMINNRFGIKKLSKSELYLISLFVIYCIANYFHI